MKLRIILQNNKKQKKKLTFTLIDNSITRKLKDILNVINLDKSHQSKYTNMCVYSDPSRELNKVYKVRKYVIF